MRDAVVLKLRRPGRISVISEEPDVLSGFDMQQSITVIKLPRRFQSLVTFAHLLERMEQGEVDAAQYRDVVAHLRQELAAMPADADLDAILTAFPAAAEVYENLRYEWAGLCRTPLELSARTEQATRELLQSIARR